MKKLAEIAKLCPAIPAVLVVPAASVLSAQRRSQGALSFALKKLHEQLTVGC